MKIALLGNMNNTNFCVMRYLRDLGLDAYLLLYTNEIEHFTPECDTYDMDKWGKYIIQTPLPNGNLFNYMKLSGSAIRKVLQGYDFYIGNGFAPAYFYKAKMKLDIFIPHCVGVEWIFQNTIKLKWDNPNNFRKSLYTLLRTTLKLVYHRPSRIRRALLMMFYKKYQMKGLKYNTRSAIAMDIACINTLGELGVPVEHYGIPVLYKLEEYRGGEKELEPYIERMKQSRMVLYSHVSHNYKGVIPLFDIKKNYILIRGFADFVKRTNNKDALLAFHEYGEDVDESKKLIKRLGIEDQVLWIPVLLRKSLMKLLDYAHIGGSEFGGAIWGSTGWEFLSKGIPFFQSVDLTEEEFQKNYGIPMPPIINVDTPAEISKHLEECYNNPELYKRRGEAGRDWYERYNGMSLATKYKNLINKMYNDTRKINHIPTKIVSYASQVMLPVCMYMI